MRFFFCAQMPMPRFPTDRGAKRYDAAKQAANCLWITRRGSCPRMPAANYLMRPVISAGSPLQARVPAPLPAEHAAGGRGIVPRRAQNRRCILPVPPRWQQITLRVRLRPSASCSGILRRTPHGFPQSMRPPGKGGGLRRFTHEIAALDFICISGGTPASCAARLYSLVLARSITFVGFYPASPRQLFTIYPLFFDPRSAKILQR